jgi:DNA (cytosine-5)-methyltransferase 1
VTLKIFESFSGYGSQSIALENIGIDYEVVATSEIDKYAIIAYDALHRHNMNTEVEQKTKEEMVEYLQNKRIAWDSKKEKCMLPKSEKQIRQLYEACVRSKNLGDISNIKVEDIPKHDLFTVSSPCTDFSVAGKTKGAMWTCKKCETKFNPFETNFTSKCPNCGSEEITKTASSLLVECSKIIQYCRPKFIFMENVKNLVGKKFKPFFDKWCEYLESLGYTNYYSVLNGKDFGIPQNRERVFMISIHGEHTPYEFPKGFPLELRLKDMLEDKVDEKYYLPQEMHDRFLAFPKNRLNNEDLEVIGTTAPNPYDKNGNIIYDKCTSAWCYSPDKCISTLSARDYKQPKQIVESNNDKFVSKKYEEFIDTDTISPTIPTSQGGGVCPKILVEKLGNIYPSNGQNGNIYSSNGISPTISAGTGIKGNGIGSNNAPKILIDKLNFVGGIGEKDWAGDGKKLSRNYPQGNRVYDENGIACSQTSNGGGLGGPTGLYLTDNKDINPIRLGGVFDDEKSRHQAGSVRDKEQLSPTLDTAQGGYREPCIVEKVQLKNSDIELTQEELPCCVASRGRNVDNPSRRIAGDDLEQRLEPNRNDCTNTLTSVSKDNYVMQRNFRIRRLTCRECFRLMGLKDYQIDLIQNAKISDTQQYKMAGNSIIVDVLEYIFSNLFKGTDL